LKNDAVPESNPKKKKLLLMAQKFYLCRKLSINIMQENKVGKISQIIGAVVDVTFDEDVKLPDIYNALEVKNADGNPVILECQYDLGENTVRTIAMDSTDGLRRGIDVTDLGRTIAMPIGDQIRGRLFNVIGDPSTDWVQ